MPSPSPSEAVSLMAILDEALPVAPLSSSCSRHGQGRACVSVSIEDFLLTIP